MSIKEKVMGWIETARRALEESNNVSSTTYPDDKSTYQDYTTKPQEKK